MALIVVGVYHAVTGDAPPIPPESTYVQELNLTVIALLLRSFANGCSSMTGVEAISNGVPMFKEPAAKNAVRTTYVMSGMLAFMLAGLSFLMLHYHVLPLENVTMLSRVAEQTVGRGWFYYYNSIDHHVHFCIWRPIRLTTVCRRFYPCWRATAICRAT